MLAQRCKGRWYVITTCQREVNGVEVTNSLNRHNFVTTVNRTDDLNLRSKTMMWARMTMSLANFMDRYHVQTLFMIVDQVQILFPFRSEKQLNWIVNRCNVYRVNHSRSYCLLARHVNTSFDSTFLSHCGMYVVIEVHLGGKLTWEYAFGGECVLIDWTSAPHFSTPLRDWVDHR